MSVARSFSYDGRRDSIPPAAAIDSSFFRETSKHAMAAGKQDRVLVACPHCGHAQPEPRTAFSTVCRQCSRNFRVQDALQPTPHAREKLPVHRLIRCTECGTELEVALGAQSTMCKRCGRYINLNDYHITNAVSKNFKTKGSFTLEPGGYVFNTEIFAGEAVIKGRLLGKIAVERSLTIYSTAEIKGSLSCGRLVIPAANHFRWKEPIKVGSAEISGELAAHLVASGTVLLNSSARLFGEVEAGSLVVQDGAVVVGRMHVGRKPAQASSP
jgi:cytoskeletal protein CcmA (bactofilin family)